VQLSEYFFGPLRGDGEFTLYRAHAKQIEPPSVLLPAPDSTRSSTETLEKIDHECSLRSEPNPDWAARGVALSERGVPITLVLEDPGGETLVRRSCSVAHPVRLIMKKRPVRSWHW
jgi:hypothetical protein